MSTVVAQVGLTGVSALGWGGGAANALDYPDGPETATYSVLGVEEATDTDKRLRLYVLDIGTEAVPLAVDSDVATTVVEESRGAGAELFGLGRVVATPGALERMDRYGIDAGELLARHHAGDWGDIDPADRGLNDEALRTRARLLSVYGTDDSGEDRRIWIITEADRSASTLLTPDEY